MRRRNYFEPAVQKLMGFAASSVCRDKAAELGGYDLGRCGAVNYNA
jgi:hypothetical protein